MRTLVAIMVAGLLAAGCRTAALESGGLTYQPAPPPPTASHIPTGTLMLVRLNQSLTTDMNVGDTFTATVQEPLIAQNGQTVVPQGSVITGIITGVGGADRQSAIRLNFTHIDINGRSHPFTADIVSTHRLDERVDLSDVGRAAAIGAAAGAVLGAVIGPGRLRDALIGGALGAGAGTIISLGTGTGVERVLPAGTQMRIQTTQHVALN